MPNLAEVSVQAIPVIPVPYPICQGTRCLIIKCRQLWGYLLAQSDGCHQKANNTRRRIRCPARLLRHGTGATQETGKFSEHIRKRRNQSGHFFHSTLGARGHHQPHNHTTPLKHTTTLKNRVLSHNSRMRLAVLSLHCKSVGCLF